MKLVEFVVVFQGEQFGFVELFKTLTHSLEYFRVFPSPIITTQPAEHFADRAKPTPVRFSLWQSPSMNEKKVSTCAREAFRLRCQMHSLFFTKRSMLRYCALTTSPSARKRFRGGTAPSDWEVVAARFLDTAWRGRAATENSCSMRLSEKPSLH